MIRAEVDQLVRTDGAVPNIETVYRKYSEAVARWTARLAGPELRSETEDLVQEVFMIAHRKLPGFRGEAALGTWLYRITERVVSQRRRKDRLRRWLLLSHSQTKDTETSSGTPLDAVRERQAAERIYRALDGLGENQRAAFILFEIEELSGQQIAALKGVSVKTVWVWLHRARARFLARLSELENEGDG